jgi:hypothetical protein
VTALSEGTPDLSGLFILESYDDRMKESIFRNLKGWLHKINPEIAKISQVRSDEEHEGVSEEIEISIAA